MLRNRALKPQYINETLPLLPLNESWLDVINIADNDQYQHELVNICQRHQSERRWILLINPEQQHLLQLNESENINKANILSVHAGKTPFELPKLAGALSKGHCAAIVICNANIDADELIKLQQGAQQGHTRCIVLKNGVVLKNSVTIH